MRLFLSLVFGALLGATAVLVYLTVDTDFDPGNHDGGGGVGNIRVEFDRDALEALIAQQLSEIDGLPDERSVSVLVREEGLVDVDLAVGAGDLGVTGTVVLNPEVVEGRLAIEVVEARVGDLPAPDAFVAPLEAAIAASFAGVADGLEYRLVAIITRDGVLAFEIAV